MINKKKVSVWVAALSYVGAFVGAGFISGQEFAQFFIRFGLRGLIGWIVVVCVIIFGGGLVLSTVARLGPKSFDQLISKLFGKNIVFIINLVINGYLIGGLIIMLSGAGNLISQLLPLPISFDVVCVGLAVLAVIVGRSKRLLSVNKILIPVLIISILASTVYILTSCKQNFDLLFNYQINNPSPILTHWALSVLLYIGYNAIGAVVALVNIARDVIKKDAYKAGRLGGIIIGFLGTLLIIVLLVTYPGWRFSEMPVTYILKERFVWIYPIFVPAMLIAMFSVAITYAMGIANYFNSRFNINYYLTCIGVIVFATPLALFGFSRLLGIIYPIFGILATIIMLYLALKLFSKKLVRTA